MDAINKVLKAQDKTKKGKKTDGCNDHPSPSDKQRRPVVPELGDVIDVENDTTSATIGKLCAHINYLMYEMREMRKELEAKAEFTDVNTMSLAIESVKSDLWILSDKVDEL